MSSNKRLKKRGEPVVMRTKKNEPEYIMSWLNSQSNISESIRFLIEQDVAENGIRDIGEALMNKLPGQPFKNQNNTFKAKPKVRSTQQNQHITEVSDLKENVIIHEDLTTDNESKHIQEIEKKETKESIEQVPNIGTKEDQASNSVTIDKNNNKKESETVEVPRPVVRKNLNLNKW